MIGSLFLERDNSWFLISSFNWIFVLILYQICDSSLNLHCDVLWNSGEYVLERSGGKDGENLFTK